MRSWGESAGALSVAHQMLADGGDTKGLFRGAWMNSGSLFSGADITEEQPTFDFIASSVGCTPGDGALECLRSVPAESIKSAMNNTPTIFGFNVRSIVVCGVREYVLISV